MDIEIADSTFSLAGAGKDFSENIILNNDVWYDNNVIYIYICIFFILMVVLFVFKYYYQRNNKQNQMNNDCQDRFATMCES